VNAAAAPAVGLGTRPVNPQLPGGGSITVTFILNGEVVISDVVIHYRRDI
jgi:hypothetical protein